MDDGGLTTAEATRRLGVKPATLYAYVSRGLVRRQLSADGRTSRFDAADVDRLAARGRRGRVDDAGLDLVLATAVSRLDAGGIAYRGTPAVDLAGRTPFEAVARLVWDVPATEAPFSADEASVAAVRAAVTALPPAATVLDRLKVAAVAAAAGDPLRADVRPGAVAAVGERLLALLAQALPERGRPPRRATTTAARLWPRLTSRRPEPADLTALDGALVLLVDHELAISTLAARVAASGRADPYTVVGAGLAAVDGLLHGAASRQVHDLLVRCGRPEAAVAVVGEELRAGRALPGFGHRVLTAGDPRADRLLELVRAAGLDGRRLGVVEAFLDATGSRLPVPPNVDLALGALTYCAHMAPDAGSAIFAVARTAGWLAHAAEEYAEAPLRFRGRARYVGR